MKEDRWRNMCKVSLQIIVYFLLIFLSPLILLVTALFYVYKYWILKLTVKYFKPKLLNFMSEREGFFATDRFWEDSRASSGLILILDGNVELEQFREDFLKYVVKAKSSINCLEDDEEKTKLFPRLTQVPQSFGGYYFWRKANYFLIHEHIRPIQDPVDEMGLKKFAGTVLTLPYPNKRPNWEILVFPTYINTNSNVKRRESLRRSRSIIVTEEIQSNSNPNKIVEAKDTMPSKSCSSALVIRMHQSVADIDLIMHMVSLLCNNYSVSCMNLKTEIGEKFTVLDYKTNSASEKNIIPQSTFTLEMVQKILKIPKFLNAFVTSFISPSPIKSLYNCDNNAIVSWSKVLEASLNKIKSRQDSVTESSVLISTIIGALNSSSIKLIDVESNENVEKCSISLPILCSLKATESPTSDFTFLTDYQHTDSSIHNNLDAQIVSTINEHWNLKASKYFLKFLSIFPHPIVRHVTFHWLRGATIYFQESKSDIQQLVWKSQLQNNFRKNQTDLIFMKNHQLVDVIPLCSLQFKRTAISGSFAKFQGVIKLSVTVNTSLIQNASTISKNPSLGSTTSTNSKYINADKQSTVDQIANAFPLELDKILDHGKDEQGFVTISMA